MPYSVLPLKKGVLGQEKGLLEEFHTLVILPIFIFQCVHWGDIWYLGNGTHSVFFRCSRSLGFPSKENSLRLSFEFFSTCISITYCFSLHGPGRGESRSDKFSDLFKFMQYMVVLRKPSKQASRPNIFPWLPGPFLPWNVSFVFFGNIVHSLLKGTKSEE